jgi:hypothetical protein
MRGFTHSVHILYIGKVRHNGRSKQWRQGILKRHFHLLAAKLLSFERFIRLEEYLYISDAPSVFIYNVRLSMDGMDFPV